MTGRELILYILENELEDEDILKDGKFVGLKTLADVAEECGVGTSTVQAWAKLGMLPSTTLNGVMFIPANYISPM